MELHQLTIHELQEKIKSGDVSATQITQSVFSRIDAVEERVHAYIRLLREEAMAAAAKADEYIKNREHHLYGNGEYRRMESRIDVSEFIEYHLVLCHGVIYTRAYHHLHRD